MLGVRQYPSYPSSMSSITGRLRNRRYICTGIVVDEADQNLRWRANSAPKRTQMGAGAAVRVGMYTSEGDFHTSGIYEGSARVWATAWDVFRRAPSRVYRGRRAAVDFVVYFGWGSFFVIVFVFISSYFFERTRPTASTSSTLPHVPLY